MASTTIVPFASLPSCASSCGPLYDVNGKCVPPATTSAAVSVYDACFCSDSRLTLFSTTTAGVCDDACTADPSGYNSITSWYKSLCSNVQAGVVSSTSSDSSSSTSSSKSGSGSGGWMSNHWQWVIFIVVMVIGIAGIWIGAALWRRHYLRKKDRQYALGKNLAQRTGSGMNPYGGTNVPNGGNQSQQGSMNHSGPGVFMGGGSTQGANGYNEKPPKKKWHLLQRS